MRHLGRFVDTRKPSPYYSRLFVALRIAQGPEPSQGTKWPGTFHVSSFRFKVFWGQCETRASCARHRSAVRRALGPEEHRWAGSQLRVLSKGERRALKG